MNAFTMIARMKKEAHKDAMRAERMGMTYDDVRTRRMEQLWEDNMDTYVLAKQFQHEAKKRCHELGLTTDANKLKQTYFITIRPDDKSVNFSDFFDDVMLYTTRRAIHSYILTFEQKGENEDELGKGFHAHMIVKSIGVSWRSKGEVLRDTQSTFKKYTSANCIEVQILKTIDDYNNVYNYLTEYTSTDGHKIPTRDADIQWRVINEVNAMYQKGSILPVLSSPGVLAGEQRYTVSQVN